MAIDFLGDILHRLNRGVCGQWLSFGSLRIRVWHLASCAAIIVIIAGIVCITALTGDIPVGTSSLPTNPAVTNNLSLPPRITAPADALVTPGSSTIRDLSFGASDVVFAEQQINQPGIYGNEILFSAGTGSLNQPVLTKVYLYNLDTGIEEKIAQTSMYMGEYYETLVNRKWLVWLETDRGKNNIIYVKDRTSGEITKLKNCENGKPKLRLYGDILIWMEQVSESLDTLYMIDLVSKEDLELFSFQDVATYGVSAPCIYEDWITWSGPLKDESVSVEEATPIPNAAATDSPTVSATATPASSDTNQELSSIYYMKIGGDVNGNTMEPLVFSPGTYVHEPLFNGQVFVWIDGNKSPNSNLYVSQPDGEPIIIATGVTTYSVGDDIVVYGKDEGVWVYCYRTGETCRLTCEGERGMLPVVTGRTVVWYNLSDDGNKDVLRFKILTDSDLMLGE